MRRIKTAGARHIRAATLLRYCLSVCTALVVSLFALGAFAKTSIVIRDFEGPRKDQARAWVVKLLDKNADYDVVSKKKLDGAKAKLDGNPEGYQGVSQELGVAAILEGVVSHKGVKWKLELNVVDGATGESLEVLEFNGNFPAGLKKAVNKDLLDKLKGPIAKAQVAKAPEPEAKDEPKAEEPKDEPKDDEPKDEPKDEEPKDEPASKSDRDALRLALRGGVMNRKFEYTDDLNGTLRPYDLGAAPFARLDLEWYPLAGGDSAVGNLGLVGGYQQAFALSSETSDGTKLDTSSREFNVGLRWRFPIGDHELGLSARYGQHTFTLDDGDRNFIPSVNYGYIRPALDARLGFGSVFLGLGVGYRFVLDSGEFAEQPWFPDQSVGAVDGHLEFGLAVGDLDLFLGGAIERYFFTLNPDPDNVGVTDDGDAVAGGALDQYLYGYLGLAYHL
ncbi:MAG: hypothetical protein AB7S68_02920 [Polyangiaceae bacterium]